MKHFLLAGAGAFIGTVSAHIIIAVSAMAAASSLWDIANKSDEKTEDA